MGGGSINRYIRNILVSAMLLSVFSLFYAYGLDVLRAEVSHPQPLLIFCIGFCLLVLFIGLWERNIAPNSSEKRKPKKTLGKKPGKKMIVFQGTILPMAAIAVLDGCYLLALPYLGYFFATFLYAAAVCWYIFRYVGIKPLLLSLLATALVYPMVIYAMQPMPPAWLS